VAARVQISPVRVARTNPEEFSNNLGTEALVPLLFAENSTRFSALPMLECPTNSPVPVCEIVPCAKDQPLRLGIS